MKIALDAMGGDHAPQAAVHGAVWAARDFGLTVQLVGQPTIIEAELAKHNTTGLELPIIPASQVIEMNEHPGVAIRNKKDSSMMVAMRSIKAGASDAFVTAGNSGGALAAAIFGLGRIKGIKRPALSTIFPDLSERGFCLLLDVGANTDVKPEYLVQFAMMGYHYALDVLKIDCPRVGLLSTGEEEEKGNTLIQIVTPMLKASPLNFIGNVESKDIPHGIADVIVTDGFTGNIYIKGVEGLASAFLLLLEREIRSRFMAQVGAFLAQDVLKTIKARFDYREFGGGPLLGVNGIVIVAHGRADPYTIRNAIRVAKQAIENNIVQAIQNGLVEYELS